MSVGLNYLKVLYVCKYKMERFKQTIAKLENDVAELKQFQTKIQGFTQTKGDIHYCTGTQEFGEYELDEIDTFRFVVDVRTGNSANTDPLFKCNTYRYRLLNPTPELIAYIELQGKHYTHGWTDYIPVDIEHFENYCMKNGGQTKIVITNEIRKCLESKLWDFAADKVNCAVSYEPLNPMEKYNKKDFYIDIPIKFEQTYKISPHVSFYITPISNSLDECLIHEITTKHVVFRIKYGNFPRTFDPGSHPNFPNTIYAGLKLHYSINGIIEQNNNLLE